jgi:beta-lactamase class A
VEAYDRFGGLNGHMAAEEAFARLGCHATWHAITLDGRRQTGSGADSVVVPASVIKVLVALEAERQIAVGELDGRRRLRLANAERTPGPVGMSLFSDPVEISVRDLVTLMLTISDNVATDAVLGLVGLDAVNRLADRLGLTATWVGTDLGTMIASINAAGAVLEAAELRAGSPIRTTARDMTSLLQAIWTDSGAPATACSRLRWLMERQLTRDRLAAGFPATATVAAKSGGLMGVVRNEIGVVTLPGAEPCAVAVFVRTEQPPLDRRAVDLAIAALAGQAVAEVSG